MFIDPDITANTDRNNALSDLGGDALDPLSRAQVEEGLGNHRDGSLARDNRPPDPAGAVADQRHSRVQIVWSIRSPSSGYSRP
jgi:hypothetical protein